LEKTLPFIFCITTYLLMCRLQNPVAAADTVSRTDSCGLQRTKYVLYTQGIIYSLCQDVNTSNMLNSCTKHYTHRVSKNCAKLFLSELRQISTNFDNFWQKDIKEAKICEVHRFSTSPNLHHHTTVLNTDVPNCYTML